MKYFTLVLVLILCSSCQGKEEVLNHDPVIQPTKTPEVENQEEDEIVFNYVIEVDPLDFAILPIEIQLIELEDNVFKGQYEYNSYYYLNLNTYSEIRLVEYGNENYYAEILNFKEKTITTGNCVYSFVEGLNGGSDCDKFWTMKDEDTAYRNTLGRFGEFLCAYDKEYFDNKLHFFELKETEESKSYREVFSYEVVRQCTDALVQYFDEHYELNPSIGNEVYVDRIVKRLDWEK